MSQIETKKLDSLATQMDQLIRSGDTQAATAQMRKVPILNLNRDSRLPLARICRRLGLVQQGLKILSPVVRPKSNLIRPATDQEYSEYAVLLSRYGGITEAREIIRKVDRRIEPNADLYEAFCEISSWNYTDALKLLERAYHSTGDPYQKLIAGVNLLACLVDLERYEEALNWVLDLEEKAITQKASRLLGNIKELEAQIYLQQELWEQGKNSLNLARSILKNTKGYDQLFLKKWRAFLKAKQENSIAPLLKIKELAQTQKHWETVRDIDFMTLQIVHDQNLLDHLICGSPSVNFIKKVERKLEKRARDFYVWGKPSAPSFDIESGIFLDSQILAPDSAPHRLLKAVSLDLYAPAPTASLFGKIYPGEYFDIYSSPNRIRQLLTRLRKSFDTHSLPLEISCENGCYSLKKYEGVKVWLPTNSNFTEKNHLLLQTLKRERRTGFSAWEACEILQVSRTHFLRLKDEWLKQKKITIEGEGKSTFYKVSGF